ncbi:MAG: bifunctional acetate--CoA ligase family protein/GNAT family N-acetyltransferase [Neisseriaceae bacterium]
MKPHYLTSLICPNHVAVIGASDRPQSLGQTVFANLLSSDFKGKLYPVNIKHRFVGGLPTVNSVSKLKVEIDLAIVLTPAPSFVKVIQDCANKGIPFILLGKDLSDATAEDQKHLDAAIALAKEKGIRVLGPSLLGLMRPVLGFNASSYGGKVRPGNLALVSQSSALCTAMLDWADSKEVGFSAVIPMGEVAFDIDFGEILDFLVNDRSTQAILLHIHHVRVGRRFWSALKAATRAKPVVVIKSGRFEDDVQGLTHASQIIKSADVFDSLLARAGALRVDTISQMFTAVKVLAANYRAKGRRLAIVCNGIGLGVLAADNARASGVALAELSPETIQSLDALLPPNWSRNNPVDILGDASPLRFRTAVKLCLDDEQVDGVLVLFTPQMGTDHLTTAQMMVSLQQETSKPLLMSWLGDAKVQASRALFTQARCMHFGAPEHAIAVFKNLVAFHQNQLLLQQTPSPITENRAKPDLKGAQKVITQGKKAKNKVMPEHLSKSLLQAFHIPTNETFLAESAEQALKIANKMGYPVVLKIDSSDFFHKSDIGGVELNVTNDANLTEAYQAIMARALAAKPKARINGISVQPMLNKRNAREVMIGVTQDPIFGPVITFGAGGVTAEIQQDTALALPPLNEVLIDDMIGRTRIGKMLGAFQHMPPIHYEALKDVLIRVSEMVCELPDILELEIDPVLIDDKGAVALDARVVLQKTLPTIQRYSHMAIMPYPSNLETQATLKDGTEVVVRPSRPEDAEALQAFVRNLSDESRYNRFMSSIKQLSQNVLVRFTQLDYDREMALVMLRDTENGPEMLGIVRYVTDPDFEVCEFGMSVADEWQNKGIGTLLMNLLFNAAKDQGLSVMRGEILTANTGMQKLTRNLGFSVSKDPEDGSICLVEKSLIDTKSTTKSK